jgi:DNA-binding HxlR family transcriptional regulator
MEVAVERTWTYSQRPDNTYGLHTKGESLPKILVIIKNWHPENKAYNCNLNI